jgi:hypothetical protein
VSHNWGYVIVGYVLAAGALGGYFASVRQRARRIRRSLSDDERA